MNDELQRLRGDLNLVQDTLGTTLPFVWKDVGFNCLLATAGLMTALLAWSMPESSLRWSITPIGLAALPPLLALRRQELGDASRAARRREYRMGWVVCLVVLAAVIPYLLLQRHFGPLPQRTAGGACVFFAGVICSVLAVLHPSRRYYWGSALPLLVWGLLVPHETTCQLVLAAGSACAGAGFLTAGIQAWQLRRQDRL